MSIYSNDNIRKIAKLTTRELPQKSKNAKITVRENNGLYSNMFIYGSEFWTMYNWVQTWGKIKISEVLRATYLA